MCAWQGCQLLAWLHQLIAGHETWLWIGVQRIVYQLLIRRVADWLLPGQPEQKPRISRLYNTQTKSSPESEPFRHIRMTGAKEQHNWEWTLWAELHSQLLMISCLNHSVGSGSRRKTRWQHSGLQSQLSAICFQRWSLLKTHRINVVATLWLWCDAHRPHLSNTKTPGSRLWCDQCLLLY